MCVAKNLLNVFCTVSEKHKDCWEVKEDDESEISYKELQQKYDEWEKVVVQEDEDLDVFLNKHAHILTEGKGDGNGKDQNEWISGGIIKDINKMINK